LGIALTAAVLFAVASFTLERHLPQAEAHAVQGERPHR
jgi:hypothetical protein